MHTVSA